MYTYIYKGQTHSDFSITYMQQIGMDAEQIEAVNNQRKHDLKAVKEKVRQECSRRIAQHWNEIGQINAALGVYTSEEVESCKQCIEAHRSACNDLLNNPDLLDINYKKDEYWPS